jgi:hypothetical protein
MSGSVISIRTGLPRPAPLTIDMSVRQRLTLGDIRRANPPFIPGRIR